MIITLLLLLIQIKVFALHSQLLLTIFNSQLYFRHFLHLFFVRVVEMGRIYKLNTSYLYISFASSYRLGFFACSLLFAFEPCSIHQIEIWFLLWGFFDYFYQKFSHFFRLKIRLKMKTRLLCFASPSGLDFFHDSPSLACAGLSDS